MYFDWCVLWDFIFKNLIYEYEGGEIVEKYIVCRLCKFIFVNNY